MEEMERTKVYFGLVSKMKPNKKRRAIDITLPCDTMIYYARVLSPYTSEE